MENSLQLKRQGMNKNKRSIINYFLTWDFDELIIGEGQECKALLYLSLPLYSKHIAYVEVPEIICAGNATEGRENNKIRVIVNECVFQKSDYKAEKRFWCLPVKYTLNQEKREHGQLLLRQFNDAHLSYQEALEDYEAVQNEDNRTALATANAIVNDVILSLKDYLIPLDLKVKIIDAKKVDYCEPDKEENQGDRLLKYSAGVNSNGDPDDEATVPIPPPPNTL